MKKLISVLYGSQENTRTITIIDDKALFLTAVKNYILKELCHSLNEYEFMSSIVLHKETDQMFFSESDIPFLHTEQFEESDFTPIKVIKQTYSDAKDYKKAKTTTFDELKEKGFFNDTMALIFDFLSEHHKPIDALDLAPFIQIEKTSLTNPLSMLVHLEYIYEIKDDDYRNSKENMTIHYVHQNQKSKYINLINDRIRVREIKKREKNEQQGISEDLSSED